MISPVQQKVSAWSIDPSLVPIMGLPPKDPDDDEDDTKKMMKMTVRKKKSQRSSENRTNVDTQDSAIWLVEITTHL